eukprot:gb/GEZN01008969.1/.p1 GENE.gb/GEZN01008969.1/~~gb/GEZN01008969.1/.p1  ORF type:complete len:305 (+),score=0.55 gb/GEZN01008969.1/:186-1100(+)
MFPHPIVETDFQTDFDWTRSLRIVDSDLSPSKARENKSKRNTRMRILCTRTPRLSPALEPETLPTRRLRSSSSCHMDFGSQDSLSTSQSLHVLPLPPLFSCSPATPEGCSATSAFPSDERDGFDSLQTNNKGGAFQTISQTSDTLLIPGLPLVSASPTLGTRQLRRSEPKSLRLRRLGIHREGSEFNFGNTIPWVLMDGRRASDNQVPLPKPKPLEMCPVENISSKPKCINDVVCCRVPKVRSFFYRPTLALKRAHSEVRRLESESERNSCGEEEELRLYFAGGSPISHRHSSSEPFLRGPTSL